MKFYTKIILGLSALLLTSCNDWLDLKPDTQATEEEVYATGNGFRSVLNKLYKSMGGASLYGRELSFGMLDCMSQQYQLDENFIMDKMYVDAGEYEYNSVDLKPVVDDIWKSAFYIVANANDLLQNLKNASPDLFREGEMERDLIMGEAYACRALMHFDLLRLYAPAPVHDDGRAYVPYVEKYPDIQASAIPVKSFLEKVIADLEQARSLVAAYDTSGIGKGTLINGESRFENKFVYGTEIYPIAKQVDDFFKGRGYRMNYMTITALLARVYQYADNMDKAFECAKKVMDFEVNGTGAFTTDDYTGVRNTEPDKKTDLKVKSNLIFAIYNEKAYEDLNLEKYFKRESAGGGIDWLAIRDKEKLFTSRSGINESNDYRCASMIFQARYTSWMMEFPLSAKWYLSTDESVRNNNLSILPVIRATEMRYIMAEYYARQGNWGEARNILMEVRAARNVTTDISINSWDDFEAELLLDARREWIAEGQLFYLYKRLDADVDFGNAVVRPLQRDEYLLPVPANQSL